jgi:hypothetical protein
MEFAAVVAAVLMGIVILSRHRSGQPEHDPRVRVERGAGQGYNDPRPLARRAADTRTA